MNKEIKETKKQKMRVWWVPQVGDGSEPFHVPVTSVEEAKKVLDILAAYDGYQLWNNIKGDYSNTGGLEVLNESGEWEGWELETESDIYDDVDTYCSSDDCSKKKELKEFTKELFSEIQWKE